MSGVISRLKRAKFAHFSSGLIDRLKRIKQKSETSCQNSSYWALSIFTRKAAKNESVKTQRQNNGKTIGSMVNWMLDTSQNNNATETNEYRRINRAIIIMLNQNIWTSTDWSLMDETKEGNGWKQVFCVRWWSDLKRVMDGWMGHNKYTGWFAWNGSNHEKGSS